jgi:hypothetical protein
VAEEAEVVYARTELENMSRPDVREIALKLGLPPRKATAAMVEEILEAQGGFGEQIAESTPIVAADEVISEEMTTSSLTEALQHFPGHLHDVLDQFLTDLAKTIEGFVFNTTPEEPEEPPASTRRLSRTR